MNICRRSYFSLLVAANALFPPRPGGSGDMGRGATAPSPEYLALTAADVRFYLADLDRALNRRQELRLHFPGCFALVAPFLLFRLKRWGFSNCRALKSAQGLFLAASR
ncbi:MAG TPA: hypothetical protein VF799_03810 [Geobacteraceae bacterium]